MMSGMFPYPMMTSSTTPISDNTPLDLTSTSRSKRKQSEGEDLAAPDQPINLSAKRLRCEEADRSKPPPTAATPGTPVRLLYLHNLSSLILAFWVKSW